MQLPEICIRRPVLATMMNLALVLFGVIGLSRLPVRELPDIDPPIVSVTTIYPGAAANVMETEVTERLEEAISTIEGIKTLTSQSREQVSSITIEFNLARPIEVATQDVRDRVAGVRGLLPEDILEPTVTKQDADARPMLWIGMNSSRYSPLELTTLAEKQIKNRLQSVPGVSSVMIGGEQRFSMRLWLDAERMAAHRVTVLDVHRALRQQSIELPSGRVENLDREMSIQTRGELKTVDEFNRLVITRQGDRVVRLLDIGEAREGVENERTRARQQGRPCIFLGIIKNSKANTVEVARGIKKEIEDIRRTAPVGIEMKIAYDEAVYVERAISEVWETLAIAFGLVIVVIYVFLHNFRATLIPTVAIPVSIVGNFVVMHWLGFSVNVLTMLALVLAIGVVVDDAIIVLENIHRHIEGGHTPMKAAFLGMKEITFAVIATTVALVAVFVPLAFQTSTTGRLFVEFAIAIAGSVIISAFVALTLTPMMSARILRRVETKPGSLVRLFEATMHATSGGYRRLVSAVLSARLGVRIVGILVGGAGIALLTGWLFRSLEGDFLPEEDKGRMFCFVIAPEGSTPDYTDRMLQEMEEILGATPEVDLYGAMVAPGFGGPGQGNSGIVFVRLKDERERSVQEIVNAPGGLRMRFMNDIEGAIAVPNIPKAIDRSFSSPFQLVIQGNDLEALNREAAKIAGLLRASGFLQSVQSSFEINKPELRLSLDRERAASLGVSVEDVSRTLQILFGGLDVSRIKKDGKEYKVIAQLERLSRATPQDLDRLYVRSSGGRLVQLSSVVNREVGVAPNKIERFNRLRSATISGSPVGVTMGTAVERTEALLKRELSGGFLYEWYGESRDLKDAGRETLWIIILALVIVFMVLASQFESLIHPFTVMLTVPLAAVGAFGSLWLVGELVRIKLIPQVPAMNINLFSQIGLVLLIGLVTKNGILLVEFANQLQNRGLDAATAMAEAGAIRLRPILMTAISTIAGTLPIAIGFGAGAESRRPMGVAVVGGMISSTVLTLFVVPVVYSVFSDVLARLRPRAAVEAAGAEVVPVK